MDGMSWHVLSAHPNGIFGLTKRVNAIAHFAKLGYIARQTPE